MALENRLGITDSLELARAEERISKRKAQWLLESGTLETLNAGSFLALSEIHRYLFEDIYDFAGTIRRVNVSKGSFRFLPVLYLENAIGKIEKMPQSTFEEIIQKYVEMNIAHPFREGNGRAMRIWLDQILKREVRRVVNWSVVDKEAYLMAMERSPVKDTEIMTLLYDSLTDRIDDRMLYLRGVDASYYYEGYANYSAADGEEL